MRLLSIFVGLAIFTLDVPAHAQQLKDDLAAQVRIQGFPCDRTQGAIRDKKRSRPDYAVWVLKCSNATYRVSRAPDMLAKIEQLR